MEGFAQVVKGRCGFLELEFDGCVKKTKLANKSVRSRNQGVCVVGRIGRVCGNEAWGYGVWWVRWAEVAGEREKFVWVLET